MYHSHRPHSAVRVHRLLEEEEEEEIGWSDQKLFPTERER